MMYEYKCPVCGRRELSTRRGDRLERVCLGCGHRTLHRQFSVAIHRPVMPHFNQSVQAPVTGTRDLNEKLKAKSEEYSRRTGIDANFRAVDPQEFRSKVTNEGMDSTNEVRIKQGLKPVEF